MIVRDIKQSHPETVPVFDQLGFHPVCDDCDIQTVARKNGISYIEVLETLNHAVLTAQRNQHASNEANP